MLSESINGRNSTSPKIVLSSMENDGESDIKNSRRERKKTIEGDNVYPYTWGLFLEVLAEVVGNIRIKNNKNEIIARI